MRGRVAARGEERAEEVRDHLPEVRDGPLGPPDVVDARELDCEDDVRVPRRRVPLGDLEPLAGAPPVDGDARLEYDSELRRLVARALDDVAEVLAAEDALGEEELRELPRPKGREGKVKILEVAVHGARRLRLQVVDPRLAGREARAPDHVADGPRVVVGLGAVPLQDLGNIRQELGRREQRRQVQVRVDLRHPIKVHVVPPRLRLLAPLVPQLVLLEAELVQAQLRVAELVQARVLEQLRRAGHRFYRLRRRRPDVGLVTLNDKRPHALAQRQQLPQVLDVVQVLAAGAVLAARLAALEAGERAGRREHARGARAVARSRHCCPG